MPLHHSSHLLAPPNLPPLPPLQPLEIFAKIDTMLRTLMNDNNFNELTIV